MADLRAGIIKEVIADKAKAVVSFAQDDGSESHELLLLNLYSFKNRHYHLPDKGEQVYVLMDDGAEEGVILGAVYSEADPPPVCSSDKCYIDFSDGTCVEYDRSSHKLKLKISSGGSLEIECEGNVSVSAGKSIDFKASEKVVLTAPEIALNTASLSCSDPNSDSGICSASFKGNIEIKGQSFKAESIQNMFTGPLSISGPLNVTGSISASGTIMDAGGNSNHHEHT